LWCRDLALSPHSLDPKNAIQIKETLVSVVVSQRPEHLVAQLAFQLSLQPILVLILDDREIPYVRFSCELSLEQPLCTK
jgi:hypothetical protein